jgi:hypothetical protein
MEADPVRFRDLHSAHGACGRNILLNAFVGFTNSAGPDVILSKCEIPGDFDFLSIDIDGDDCHVWAAVQQYRPKLVVIEYNFTVPNAVLFVQDKDPEITRGASSASPVELARTNKVTN